MADPLPQNPTYIKIDDDKFYLAMTSNEQFEVSVIKDEIVLLQSRIDGLVEKLQGAAKEAVGNAQPLLDEIAKQPLSEKLKQ